MFTPQEGSLPSRGLLVVFAKKFLLENKGYQRSREGKLTL